MNKSIYAGLFLGFLLFSFIPFLYVPLGSDTGAHLFLSNLFLNGIQPYRDILTYQPLGVILLYIIPIKLFGYSMVGIRVFDLFMLLTCLGGIYCVANLLFTSRLVGFWSCLLYISFYFFQYKAWYVTTEKDFYLSIFLIWALYFFLKAFSAKSYGRKSMLILSGLLCGLAFWTKGPALFTFLGLITIVSINLFRSRPNKENLLDIIYLSIGFSITVLGVFAYCLKHNLLYLMIKDVFINSFSIYPNMVPLTSTYFVKAIIKVFLSNSSLVVLTILAMVGLGIILIQALKEKNQKMLTLLIFSLFNLFYTVMLKKFWSYHWYPFLLTFVMFGGYSVSLFQRQTQLYLTQAFKMERLSQNTSPLIVAFLLCLIVVNNSTKNWKRFWYLVKGYTTLEKFYEPYQAGGTSSLACYQAGNFIKENTTENDYIYFLGDANFLAFFLSQRIKIVTPLIGFPPYIFDIDSILPNIRQAKPEFIVDGSCYTKIMDVRLSKYYQYVRDNYMKIKSFPNAHGLFIDIYKIK